MIITGEITSKEIKEGIGKDNKAFTRCVFTILGKDYSTFDKDIYDKFVPGDFVKVELEQKGNFWNMKTMEKADKDTAIVEKVSQNGSDKEFHCAIETTRANALNSAIEYARMFNEAKEVKLTPTSEQIVGIAVYFEKYILNGVKDEQGK